MSNNVNINFISLYLALTVISGVKRNANKTSRNISKVLAIIRTGSASKYIVIAIHPIVISVAFHTCVSVY